MTAFWSGKKRAQQPSQGPRTPRRPSSGFWPQIEALEDRQLLATCTVIDLADAASGKELRGDLRYCLNTLNAAPAPDNRIVFEPGLAGTIELGRGALTITTDLEILGSGADVLAVSGGNRSGVFRIPDDPRVRVVRIADLTVT